MTFLRACSLDDLWEGEMDVFDVDDTEVLIIHHGPGQVCATQPYCPHQRVELVDGELEGKVLTCKQHLWQFDVTTCLGLNPDDAAIANYPVEVRGDDVYVDLAADSPKAAKP